MQPMQYRIQVHLLSEAIFSSGEKEANLVQSKVLADEEGFVYLHAKTLKGQLKQKAYWLFGLYAQVDPERAVQFLESIHVLFGLNGWELDMLLNDTQKMLNHNSSWLETVIDKFKLKVKAAGLIKLGHLQLPDPVRAYFKQLHAEQIVASTDEQAYIYLSRHDVIEAQTHIRVGIQLDNGIAKEGMFTSVHTVRRGLIFYASLLMEAMPNHAVLSDLHRIVYAMDRIGANIHRGRGEVECKLFVRAQEDNQQAEEGNWREVSGY